jgi:hypothetical protein
MRLRAKETQAARELLKDKKALASALANQAANKVKGSTTSDVKRNIVASNQTSALRAKRNSIAQHSKRNSILHSSNNSNKTPVVALRNKRNSIANMLKPVTATQRNSSGGMAAAMQSIRGSVAGNDSDESEDDWDSD